MPKLKYSFDDYINNPSGKGSANLATINKDQYQKELFGLESRNAKATYKVYRQSNNDGTSIYYIHFLIPSTTNNFFHDVVLEFKSNKNDSTNIQTIRNYRIKFFCNDSNFVFTYVYTFKTHGLLIEELEKFLPYRSIIQKPSTRNPDNAMGYNKNLIFAYLIMERNDLFKKETLNRQAINKGITAIRSELIPYNEKEKQRNQIIKDEKEKQTKQRSTNTKVIKSKGLLKDQPQQTPKIVNTTKKTLNSAKTTIVKKVKKR